MIVCTATPELWAMNEPFEISREMITQQPVLKITLSDGLGHTGHAEAAGVDYDGETPQSIQSDIAQYLHLLHDDVTGQELLQHLPAGGARNALDCALWDLRAKQSGVPAWKSAGLSALQSVQTAYTIGLGDEATTRRKIREASHFSTLKLKVDALRHINIVQMAREERPQARLLIDANQSWSIDLLQSLLPRLQEAGVALIEQPLARSDDAMLQGISSPIPIAADESCTDRSTLQDLASCYQYINIKLDKCGGLTEALAMVQAAKTLGLGLMVGNMCGTSLAMAPAFLIAQHCSYVDLDGPLLQVLDRQPALHYEHDLIHIPDRALWG
jgi:L-Ala-D/L-Glu epimerase